MTEVSAHPSASARAPRAGWRSVAAALAATAAGLAVTLAAATATPRPWLLLVAGIATAVTVGSVAAMWVRRIDRRISRVVAVSVVLATVAATLLLAVPFRDRGVPAAAVADQRFWSLPSGSVLRYVKIPGRNPTRSTPIIFAHGGPGTPDLAGDAAYFGQLAADGYDVYVYEEVGGGRSTRLPDLKQYSRDRDVADLESIRHVIGAERVILIGHSYGAGVVAGYLAAHPDRVARTVVLAPGPLDPADPSPGRVQQRLTTAQRVRLYGRLLLPRNLFVYTLLQINPPAAYAVAGDREMDAQNDRVYALSEPALHCPGQAKAVPPTGMGFYRLQYPQSASAPAEPDLRPAIAGNRTPTLIVKGACDYLSWSSAIGWRTVLPRSQLIYLRGGHNVYQDAPGEVLASVRAFLADRPLPVAPYPGDAAPEDYEGPP